MFLYGVYDIVLENCEDRPIYTALHTLVNTANAWSTWRGRSKR
jgi:hypothetical protein